LLDWPNELRDDQAAAVIMCTGGYVLIVDDDAFIRGALVDIVRDDFGHNVRTAGDGIEALGVLYAAPAPSLILVDLMMPRMDGATFLGHKQMEDGLAAIPVCVMTASKQGSSELSRLGDVLRPNVVLRKPFDLDDLMSIVEKYC
jgi:CheY-like chemotaxis protein